MRSERVRSCGGRRSFAEPGGRCRGKRDRRDRLVLRRRSWCRSRYREDSGLGSVTDNGDGTWKWKYTPADDATGTVTVTASDDDDEHSVDRLVLMACQQRCTDDRLHRCRERGELRRTESDHDQLPRSSERERHLCRQHQLGRRHDRRSRTGSTPAIRRPTPTRPQGPHTVTVTVSDEDGGTSPAATASAVVNFTIVGGKILQPVNDTRNGQVLPSVFKYGSTIPVKVEITNCNGAHPEQLRSCESRGPRRQARCSASADLEAIVHQCSRCR